MKFNTREIFFMAAAVALLAASAIDPSFAQNSAGSAGANALQSLQDAVVGNIGFFIGLGVTLLGLWTWIIKQETGAGIVMIIGGVLITMTPSIFNGAQDFIGGVVNGFSGGNNTVPVQ